MTATRAIFVSVAILGCALRAQSGADKAADKAEDKFPNIQILRGVPAARVDGIMQAFSRFLGVECTHCHVADKFESGEKPAFDRTRQMFSMRASLNANQLKAYAPIGCWTCHRGQPSPEQAPPPDRMAAIQWPADLELAEAKLGQPAEAVYSNIQVFKGLPSRRIAPAMKFFTASLGVECAFCHEPGNWASDDKPTKKVAREMMSMVQTTAKEFFKPGNGPSCWICHRGASKPERNPPPK